MSGRSAGIALDQRDDWDTAALRAFLGREDLDRDDACHLFLDAAGESFGRYVRHVLPVLSSLWRDGDAYHATNLLVFYAEYYRMMARAMSGDLCRLPGWQDCAEQVEAIVPRDRGAVFATFQLGAPLLIPHLLSACRPTTTLLHARNAVARSFVADRSADVAMLDVTTSTAFDLLRRLARGDHLIANVDTAYPGTRCRTIAFLDAELDIPMGLLESVPRRSGARVFAIALLYREATGLDVRLREIGGDSAPVAALAAFFEEIVRADPYQWMGWASLQSLPRSIPAFAYQRSR